MFSSSESQVETSTDKITPVEVWVHVESNKMFERTWISLSSSEKFETEGVNVSTDMYYQMPTHFHKGMIAFRNHNK